MIKFQKQKLFIYFISKAISDFSHLNNGSSAEHCFCP